MHRPDVVRAWLRGGRKFNAPPVINNLPSYTKSWWAWWAHLQPDSRKESAGNRAPIRDALPADENWAQTYVGGPNGMLIVVLTLAWWSQKLGGKTDQKDLIVAVNDVEWVLSAMIEKSGGGKTSGSVAGKRAAAPGDKVETESGTRAKRR